MGVCFRHWLIQKFFIMKCHTAWHRVLKNVALLEDPLNATLKILVQDCPHYEILLLYQYPNLLNGVPEELIHTDFFLTVRFYSHLKYLLIVQL